MTIELGRRLLSSGAVSSEGVHAALFAHVAHGSHFLHALILRGAVDEATIDREVARAALPSVPKVVPNLDLVARLPRGLCAALLAVPVRIDPFTTAVDVAAADPFDTHVAAEFAFHLQARVRVLYARVSSIDRAVDDIERALGEGERMSSAFALDGALKRANTPVFGSVAAAIAVQAARRSSGLPIPLVRRSHGPKAAPPPRPAATDSDEPDGDDYQPRITQDAIVLDPAAIGAAARQLPAPDDDDMREASLPRPPQPPRLPSIPEPPFLDAIDLEEALVALEHSASRDAVVSALLRGMLSCSGRVAVFAVRRDVFTGWACTPSVMSAPAFRAVTIPRSPPSALVDAASRGWFLGDLSDSEADHALARLFDPPAGEVSVVAVRLSGRVAMLVAADQLSDAMIATRTADRLTRSAAAALLRILRTDKLQGR